MSKETITPQPTPSSGGLSPNDEWGYVIFERLFLAYYLIWMVMMAASGRNHTEQLLYSLVILLGVWPARFAPRVWREDLRLRRLVCVGLVVGLLIIGLLARGHMTGADQFGIACLYVVGAGIVLYARWLRQPFNSSSHWIGWLALLAVHAWISHPNCPYLARLWDWLF